MPDLEAAIVYRMEEGERQRRMHSNITFAYSHVILHRTRTFKKNVCVHHGPDEHCGYTEEFTT
jgi:hypothetical protein